MIYELQKYQNPMKDNGNIYGMVFYVFQLLVVQKNKSFDDNMELD